MVCSNSLDSPNSAHATLANYSSPDCGILITKTSEISHDSVTDLTLSASRAQSAEPRDPVRGRERSIHPYLRRSDHVDR